MRRFVTSSGGMALLALSVVMMVSVVGCTATKTSDRSIVYIDADEAAAVPQGRRGAFGMGREVKTAYLDARPYSDYLEARLPGAIFMPIESARDESRRLREYDVLVVYGGDFNSVRADALSKTLLELGHDVRTIRGGIRMWRSAGHPVESGSPKN